MFLGSILFFLVLFILTIIFRRPLILLIIRIRHGKYSFDFQDKYKSYFNSNPHPYCFKDELLQHIISLKKSADLSQGIVEEHVPSIFMNTPFDLTPKDLVATKGEPVCFNAYRDQNYDFKLFGYPHNQFHYSSKMLYYYYKDKLFAMDCIFVDFPQNKMDDLLENISKVLGLKLVNEKTKTFYLKDNFRILYTNTGFRISLKMYCPTLETFMDVISIFEKQQSDLKNQIENHFFTSASS